MNSAATLEASPLLKLIGGDAPAEWRLTLFGGLNLEHHGRAWQPVGSRKAALLLAALGVQFGRARSREELCELLWPASEPELARTSLRQALATLRRCLPDPGGRFLLADRVSVNLSPEDAWCDLAQFHSALRRSRAADSPDREAELLELALNAWTGDLLPEFSADWLRAIRVDLRDQAVEAMLRAAKLARSREDWDRALGYAEAAIAAEPLREESIALHLEISRDARASARGLIAYRDYERRCQVELGASPSPNVMWLAGRLRRDAPPVRTGQPNPQDSDLPEMPWPLVGREPQLASLGQWLRGSGRWMTLVGLGGAGKTHLALAFAHQIAIPVKVVVAPDVPDDPSRTGLIILDQAEQLEPMQLRALEDRLTESPGLRVLATSREPLGVRGESVLTVGPMPDEDALALVLSQAKCVGCTIGPEELAGVSALARAWGGFPCQLVPGARRLRSHGSLELLDPVDSPTAIDGALAWVASRVGDPATLVATTAFRGGFSRQAYEAVLGTAEGQVELDRLVALCVVEPRRTAGGVRFHLSNAVRRSITRCSDLGALPRMQARHADFYAQMLDKQWEAFMSGRQEQAIATVRIESENIVQALAYLREADAGLAVWLAIRVVPFWHAMNRLAEALDLVEPLLDSIPVGIDEARVAMFRQRVAVLQYNLDRPDEARANLEMCIGAFRKLEDAQRLGEALNSLGMLHCRFSEGPDEALHVFEEALAIFEATGRDAGCAMVLNNQALVMIEHGDLGEAEARLDRALAINRRTGHQAWELANLSNLALVAVRQGRCRLAASCLDQCRQIQGRLGVQPSVHFTAACAQVAMATGSTESARSALAEGVARARQERHSPGLATMVVLAASWLSQSGAHGPAMRCLGIVESLLALHRWPMSPYLASIRAEVEAAGRNALGADAVEEAAIGRGFAIETALDWLVATLRTSGVSQQL